MDYNDTIKNQLVDFIKKPAVLMTKEDVPYEFMDRKVSINRLKRRRDCKNIPYELYSFMLTNDVSKNQLREFASGLFLNYIQTSKIYV